jgi:hypothetical protein
MSSSSENDEEISIHDELGYETTEGLLDAAETNGSQEIRAEDFVLVRSATKKTKVLYVGQVEEKEGFTYKVQLMCRLLLPKNNNAPCRTYKAS